MLALVFSIGDDRFAIRGAEVVEVVPRVRVRGIPHAPMYVTGTFTYRGAVVPLVDLCRLLRGTPCPERLSTRIVLVRDESESARSRLLGLLAERITDTIDLDERSAVPPAVEVSAAPYLGDIYVGGDSTIQMLDVGRLLGETLHGLSFSGDDAQ